MEFMSIFLFLGGLAMGGLIVWMMGRWSQPPASNVVEVHPSIDAARKMLERQGYRIGETGKRELIALSIWGKRTTAEIVADFVVEKMGKKAVVGVDSAAEEKFGSLSDDTRRKILEAQHAFPNLSVLLIRPSTGEITEVSLQRRGRDLSSPAWVVGILAAVV